MQFLPYIEISYKYILSSPWCAVKVGGKVSIYFSFSERNRKIFRLNYIFPFKENFLTFRFYLISYVHPSLF